MIILFFSLNTILLNNNIINLRWATRQENTRYSKLSSKNTSGIKGVSFHKKTKKWRAQIKVGEKRIHLGRFDSEIEAHNSYLKFVKENNL